MDKVDEIDKSELYTIGHSNHPLERFLDLLSTHAIEVVVDTRSSPYSQYVPQYNREELQAALTQAGIKYLHMGKELGGRPEEDEFYDAQDYVLYARLARSPTFLAGIERLEKGMRRWRVALLCSEENPAVCHRHLLVGRVMARRGAKILHLRADGGVQTDADIPSTAYEQRTLFELAEEDTWKSLRSVSRKKQPRNSSESSGAMKSSDWSMSD